MTSLLRPWTVRVHLVVVLAVAGAMLGMWAAKGADTNIGAGAALILLELLGLPWSVPLLLDPRAVPWPWPPVVASALAGLNVVLHAVLRRRITRVRTDSADSSRRQAR